MRFCILIARQYGKQHVGRELPLNVTEVTQTDPRDRPSAYTLLGMKLNPMTTGDLLELLQARINAGQQCLIAYQNLHGMHFSYIDEAFNRLHQRQNCFVYIDGFPIYLLSRLFGYSVARRHRITGNDYIWPLLSLAEQGGWRLYLLGGNEKVLSAASDMIRHRVPDLVFRAHHGYFDAASEGDAVIKDILAFAPALVIVGLGMPLQEQWILENAALLASTSVCAMGAIIDYISGSERVPPRWLGAVGLEWLFRLIDNPARFWQRYLFEPWLVLANVALFSLKRK